MDIFSNTSSLIGDIVSCDNDLLLYEVTLFNENERNVRVCLTIAAVHLVGDKSVPNIGDIIIASNLLKVNDIYYVTQYGDFQLVQKDSIELVENLKIVKLLKESQWKASDIIIFYNNYPAIDLSALTPDPKSNWHMNLLDYLLKEQQKNIVFPLIKFGSELNYFSPDCKYCHEWMFSGVHHSSARELTVGHLSSNSLGRLQITFSDGNSLDLLIFGSKSEEIKKVFDKIVFIKNFTIYSEIYKNKEFKIYMGCHLDDIKTTELRVLTNTPIYVKQCAKNLIPNAEIWTICITSITIPQSISLEDYNVSIVTKKHIKDNRWRDIVITLPETHFKTLPLLQVNGIYDLYINPDTKKYKPDHLIEKLLKTSIFFIKECYFVPNNNIIGPEANKIYKSEEISQINRNELVHFDGIVVKRFIRDNDDKSRTVAFVKNPDYGTLLTNNHEITFMIENDPNVEPPRPVTPTLSTSFTTTDLSKSPVTVRLYLNNLERKVCPIGLVAGMKVRVYSVKYLGYFLTTAATNFEILDYNHNYSTANLNSQIDRVFYGAIGGHDVHVGAIIRTKVKIVSIKSIEIKLIDEVLSSTITFKTKDLKGSAVVICKEIEFLKKYFFKNEEHFEDWLKKFKCIEIYSTKDAFKPIFTTAHVDKCYKEMDENFKTRATNITEAEILCRRLATKSISDNDGMSLWYLLTVYHVFQ